MTLKDRHSVTLWGGNNQYQTPPLKVINGTVNDLLYSKHFAKR